MQLLHASCEEALWWLGLFNAKGYLCSWLWWPNFFFFFAFYRQNWTTVNHCHSSTGYYNRPGTATWHPPSVLQVEGPAWLCIQAGLSGVADLIYPGSPARGLAQAKEFTPTILSPILPRIPFPPPLFFPIFLLVLLGGKEWLLWLMLAIVLTSFNRPENTNYGSSRPPHIWSVGLVWEMQSALLWG